jgi:hypothetical protein
VALVIWLILGAAIADMSIPKVRIAETFGALFLLPLWFGTMFTRQTKEPKAVSQ